MLHEGGGFFVEVLSFEVFIYEVKCGFNLDSLSVSST